MHALALYDGCSGVQNAYFHRVRSLLNTLEPFEVTYDEAFLMDMQFKRPAIRRLKNAKEVRKILTSKKFDFIHAANNTAAAAASIAAKGLDIPVLFDAHGDVIAESKQLFAQTRSRRDFIDVLQMPMIESAAVRQCDHMLVVSTPLRDHYKSKGVPIDRMTIVRNGVDIEAFPALPPPKENQPFIIGYAGAMQVWQGLDLLISAIELVNNPYIKFIVMGFLPEDAGWKQKFHSRCGNKVELIDRGSREELLKELSRTHACVIPRLPSQTVKVAMPTKFGEYLAMERPVIVTDVDETTVFIREKRCGLVSMPHAIALAQTFEQMAELPEDQRIELARNGREFAEKEFTWNYISNDYRAAIMHLMKDKIKF